MFEHVQNRKAKVGIRNLFFSVKSNPNMPMSSGKTKIDVKLYKLQRRFLAKIQIILPFANDFDILRKSG